MCHGNIDPGLMMRDMERRLGEQRLGAVTVTQENGEQGLSAPPAGLAVWLRGLVARLNGKEERHV